MEQVNWDDDFDHPGNFNWDGGHFEHPANLNWDDEFNHPGNFNEHIDSNRPGNFNQHDDFNHPGNVVMDTRQLFRELRHQQERQRAYDQIAEIRGFGDAGFDAFFPRGPRGFTFPEAPRRNARRSRWDVLEDEFITPLPSRYGRRGPWGPPPRRGHWDW